MVVEIGTHSPWISRLLSELGIEVIVANARKVRLIGESRKKDDRIDARTLARLARIDPELLCPVKHRSAQAQADPDRDPGASRLRASSTALVNTARGPPPYQPREHGRVAILLRTQPDARGRARCTLNSPESLGVSPTLVISANLQQSSKTMRAHSPERMSSPTMSATRLSFQSKTADPVNNPRPITLDS